MTSDADSHLLEQFVRKQDSVAFDQLARRYRAMVFATARRVTQSHHDAEDVAQSCFLELAKKAGSIRISIPAFLHATAMRRSIDLLRDKNRRRKHETKAASDRSEPLAIDDSTDRSWEEISPEVDQAIDRLPDELKTLVILYFLRGLSIVDIATETGLNRSKIERRLHLGVRRLRADLAKGNRMVSAGVLAIGLKSSVFHAVPASLTASTGRMALAAGLHAAPCVQPWRGSGILLLRWAVWTASAGIAMAFIASFSLSHFKTHGIDSNPYDQMRSLYAGYLPTVEVAGFPLHSAAMRFDASSFWRGSQPLFFWWCKSNCRDWFADRDRYVLCHASPNLEDAERLPEFVNADNSARMPMQIELLQGMIIARLASDHALGEAPDDTTARVASALCQAYRASLLRDQPLIEHRADITGELRSDQYIDPLGNLKSLILSPAGKVLAFLRPAPLDCAQVQGMLTDALSRSTALRNACGDDHPQIRAVRSCVRHNAVVTQGQLLLIAQLDNTGLLLEFKQQIPSPAELADAVPRDPRSPGQRAAEDAAMLHAPGIAPVSWCQWNEKSFTVTPLELHPQVYELRKDRWLDPVQAARSWALATGASHQKDSNRDALASGVDSELESKLITRSDAFLRSMRADLAAFDNDPRVGRDQSIQDALSASWLEQARRSN